MTSQGRLVTAPACLLVQGTLKWASGERYDGEWRVGEESGVGIYTWPDGSTYNGFWAHGKKNGASPISTQHFNALILIMSRWHSYGVLARIRHCHVARRAPPITASRAPILVTFT